MRFLKGKLEQFSIENILDFILLAGITGIIFFRPLISGVVYPDINLRFLIISISLFFVFFIKIILIDRAKIKINIFLILNLLFILWAAASLYTSINKYESVLFLVNMLGYFFLYLIILNVDLNRRKVRFFLSVIIVSGVLVSFFGLHQFFFGLREVRKWVHLYMNTETLSKSFISRLSSSRIFSTFVYPNALGGYIILIIPIVTVFYWNLLKNKEDKKYRNIFFLIILISMTIASAFLVEPLMNIFSLVFFLFFPLLLLTALLLSVSKGSFISLFIVMIISSIIFFYKKEYLKYIVIALIVLLVLGIMTYYLIEKKAGWTAILQTINVRLEYWKATSNIIMDWPIWGTGPGTFGNIYGKYKLAQAEETRMAHNNYLQIGAETGIPGGIIYLLMWIFLSVQSLIIIRKAWSPFSAQRQSVLSKGLDPKYKSLLFQSNNSGNRQIMLFISIGLWMGIVCFMIHSFFDFDLYIPGVALIVWFFAGLIQNIIGNFREIRLPPMKKYLKIVCIIVVWLISVLGILKCKDYIEANTLMKKGVRSFNKREWIKAKIFFEKAIKIVPIDFQAYFYLGKISEMLGEYKNSISYIEKASELNPFSAIIHYYTARAYIKDPEVNKGIGHILYHYKKAVECFPTRYYYHMEYAAFLESENKYHEALGEYDLALMYGGDEKEILDRIERIKLRLKETATGH